MTIDEAIKHAEEVAEEKAEQAWEAQLQEEYSTIKSCKNCAKEHKQLAEWLKDYKRLLEQNEELQKENEDFKNYIDLANHTNSQLIQLIEKHKINRDICEDCVSRQQALKELKESAEHHANDSREEALLRRDRDIIRALPPVTPARKKSKWVTKYHGFPPEPTTACLNCGFDRDFYIRAIGYDKIKFCPNCGKEIEGEE